METEGEKRRFRDEITKIHAWALTAVNDPKIKPDFQRLAEQCGQISQLILEGLDRYGSGTADSEQLQLQSLQFWMNAIIDSTHKV